MSIFQAAIYGLVQGITEFLPISSSAHLLLLPWFFKWPDPGLAFDVALHWGTLLALVIYYWRDCVGLIRGLFTRQTLPWKIALATVPAVVAGVLVEKLAEQAFRSPWVTAATLSGVGLFLYYADQKASHEHTFDTLTWRQAFAVGCFQALALVPGVSRSGITISTALLLGLDRSASVRLSFLLSIPITLGACVLKSKYLVANAGDPSILTAIAVSAISGFLAIRFLVAYVRTKTFTPFVIYRLILAGTIVFFLLK